MRLCVTGKASVAVLNLNPATMQTDATVYRSSAVGAEVCPTHIEGKPTPNWAPSRLQRPPDGVLALIEDLTGTGHRTTQADVAVIGAGTAGPVIAAALARRDLSVLCLGSGGWKQKSDEHPLNEVVRTKSVYLGAAMVAFVALLRAARRAGSKGDYCTRTRLNSRFTWSSSRFHAPTTASVLHRTSSTCSANRWRRLNGPLAAKMSTMSLKPQMPSGRCGIHPVLHCSPGSLSALRWSLYVKCQAESVLPARSN